MDSWNEEDRRDNSRFHSSVPPSTTLYVIGVPLTYDETDIKKLFGTYGEVVRCNIGKAREGSTKTFCFVDFSSKEEAEHALRGLDRKHPLNMRVDFAISKTDRKLIPKPRDRVLDNPKQDDFKEMASRPKQFGNSLQNPENQDISGSSISLSNLGLQPNIQVRLSGQSKVVSCDVSKGHFSNRENMSNNRAPSVVGNKFDLDFNVVERTILTSSKGYKNPSTVHEFSQMPCTFCNKPGGFRCQRCKVWYCGQPCQVKDWPKHKLICKVVTDNEVMDMSNMSRRPVSRMSSTPYNGQPPEKNVTLTPRRPANEDDQAKPACTNDRTSNLDTFKKPDIPKAPDSRSNDSSAVNKNNVERRFSALEKITAKGIEPGRGRSVRNVSSCTAAELRRPLRRPGETPVAIKSSETQKSIIAEFFASGPCQVRVCFVVSPGEFYVQKTCNDQALNSLLVEVHQEATCGKGLNVPLQPEDHCIALFSDGCWYRARVIKTVDSQTQEVFFVDYGNKYVVKLENLRLLPLKFRKLPEQCIRCSIGKVKTLGSAWNPEEAAQFETLISDLAFVCHLLVEKDGLAVVDLEDDKGQFVSNWMLDLCSPNKTQSTSDSSKQVSRGKGSVPEATAEQRKETLSSKVMQNPVANIKQTVNIPQSPRANHLPMVQVPTAFPKKDLLTSEAVVAPLPSILSSMQKGSEPVAATVTWIVDERNFWATICNQELAEKVAEAGVVLASALEKELSSTSGMNINLESGQLVGAKSSDGFVYRALLKSKLNSVYKVLFLDFGNEEEVTHVIPLPSKLAEFASPVLQCQSEKPHALQLDNSVLLKMACVENTRGLSVMLHQNGQEVCRLVLRPWYFEHIAMTKEAPVISAEKQISKPERKVHEASEPSRHVCNKSTEVKAPVPSVISSLAGKAEPLTVTITWIVDKQIFCASIIDQDLAAKVAGASQILADTFQKGDFLTHSSLHVGQLVGAKASDGFVYRAMLKVKISQNSYKVLFLDFGNEEEVANVIPLPSELATFPSPNLQFKSSKPQEFQVDNSVLIRAEKVDERGGVFVMLDKEGNEVCKLAGKPWYFRHMTAETTIKKQEPEKKQSVEATVLQSTEIPSDKPDSEKKNDEDLKSAVPQSRTVPNSESNLRNVPLPSVLSNLCQNTDPLRITVTWIVDQRHFWASVFNQELAARVAQASELLASHFENDPSHMGQPETGQLVCAKSSDGFVYRALLKSKLTASTFKVLFLDFGNEEVVSHVKPLPPTMTDFASPVLQFESVKPQELYLDSSLIISVASLDETQGSFVLLDEKGKEVCKLIGRPWYFGHIEEPESKDEAGSGKVTPPCNKSDSSQVPLPSVLCSLQVQNDPIVVTITWIIDSKNFWASVVNHELAEKVSTVCVTLSSSFDQESVGFNPDVGQLVGAKSSDGFVYRAVVKNKLRENSFRVLFFDFGNEEEVDRVMPLPSTIAAFASPALQLQFEEPRDFSLNSSLLLRLNSLDETCGLFTMVSDQGKDLCKVVGRPWYIESEKSPASLPVHIEKQVNEVKAAEVCKPVVPVCSKPPDLKIPSVLSTLQVQPDPVAVFVTWIVDSQNFWASVVDNDLTQRTSELSATLTASFAKDSVGYSCSVGQLVSAKSSDNECFRALVKTCSKDGMYRVLFLDFGNEEDVSSVAPLPSVGSDFASPTLQFVSTKPLQLNLNQILSLRIVTVDSSCVSCVLIDNEGQQIDELVGKPWYSDLLDDPDSGVSSPSLIPTSQDVVLFNCLPKRTFDESFQASVAWANSVKEIYLQKTSDAQELHSFMSKLASCITDDKQSFVPTVDQLVLAMFEDGAWYRAKVETVSDESVSVHFIDYGNQAEVPLCKLKQCPTDYIELAPFAIRVALDGMESLTLEQTQELMEKVWNVQVVGTVLELPSVHLSGPNGRFGFPDKAQSPAKDGSPTPVKTPEVYCTSTFSKQPYIDLPVDQRLNVTISSVSSPELIYINYFPTESSLVQVTKLIDDLQSYCATAERPSDYQVVPAQFCLAKFHEDNLWYRAVILSKTDSNVNAIFVDYGNMETITEPVLPIPVRFMEVPLQAPQCKLYGIREDTWTDIVCETLRDKLMGKTLEVQIISKEEYFYVVDIPAVRNEMIEAGLLKPDLKILPASLPEETVSVCDKANAENPVASDSSIVNGNSTSLTSAASDTVTSTVCSEVAVPKDSSVTSQEMLQEELMQQIKMLQEKLAALNTK